MPSGRTAWRAVPAEFETGKWMLPSTDYCPSSILQTGQCQERDTAKWIPSKSTLSLRGSSLHRHLVYRSRTLALYYHEATSALQIREFVGST
jgi:hypothetical protein